MMSNRSERTKKALKYHKYLMFFGFWLCVSMALSELSFSKQTTAKQSNDAVKIRHYAAFLNDKNNNRKWKD